MPKFKWTRGPVAKVLTVAFLVGAFSPAALWAGDRLAPSAFRRLCEEALIASGVYKPAPKALLTGSSQNVERLSVDTLSVRLTPEAQARLFKYTNRDGRELRLQGLYPSEFLSYEKLRGLKIIDLACGEGQWVEDLRRHGIDAIGLDIYLRDYEKSKPYFVEASMDSIPLPDQSFDLAMSTMGPFYYLGEDREVMQKMLKEAHRILKPGGILRISPIPFVAIEGRDIEKFGAQPSKDLLLTGMWPLPKGLVINAYPGKNWFVLRPDDMGLNHYWLELKRVD